jgi:hypothetical protein
MLEARGGCPACGRPIQIQVFVSMDARERVFRDVVAYCWNCRAEKGRRHLLAEEASNLMDLLTQKHRTNA